MQVLYEELLKDVKGITMHKAPSPEYDSNYWLCTAILDPDLRIKGHENAYKQVITGAIGGAAGVTHATKSATTDSPGDDLLGRSEIKISMDEIKANAAGKTVRVTGAAGSIGSKLCRQLVKLGIKELVMFDNAETPLHNVRLEFEDNYPDLKFTPIIGDVRQVERLALIFVWHHTDWEKIDSANQRFLDADGNHAYYDRDLLDK